MIKRYKTSLDIFWLKDESLEDSKNLPAPDIIAREIVDNLESALEQFAEIEEMLKTKLYFIYSNKKTKGIILD